MDMESGNPSAKRQRTEVWQSHPLETRRNEFTLPPPHGASPGRQPSYSQPSRTLSSPHPPYPKEGNGYHHEHTILPPPNSMQESRQPPGAHMPYAHPHSEVKRESDSNPDSQFRPAPSQPFPSPRPDENGHHRSPPSYNVPNGPGALPYRATGMPPALSISGVRPNFDARYAQSPDAVVSADGIYSPNPYGIPTANTSGKKKAQRASQACDSCRSLKAKCDESKPCQSCKDKDIHCTYRQPEPKAQDKIQTDMSNNIKRLLEEVLSVKGILEGVATMREDITKLTDRIQKLERKSFDPNHTETIGDVVPKTEETEHGSVNGISLSQKSDNSHHSEATAMPPTKQTENMEVEGSWQEGASDEEIAPPLNPSKPKFGIQHTTGAVEILNWPAINELVKDEVRSHRINKGKGAKTDRYLWKAEKRRAEIRTHGYGEGPEPQSSRKPNGDGSDVQAFNFEASSPPLFSEPAFGLVASNSPYQIREYNTGKKPKEEQLGGIASDGTLDLSDTTVKRLVKTYMEKMNILHPILTKKEADRLVIKFLQEVKSIPDTDREKKVSASFLGQTSSLFSKKRSRSTPDRGEYGEILSSPEIGRQLPQRSPSNAVVLLMLGLGKICEAPKIPDVIWGAFNMSDSDKKKVKGSASPDHSSPSSPASSAEHSSPHSQHPPVRLSDAEQSNISGKPRPVKNLDTVPGMAYVSIATDIIGNQLSGSTMCHIQANILASLYFGQLVRPIQSHAYLHVASRAIQDQIRLKSSLTSLPKHNIQCQPQDNPLVYAFWTCLQLECDIVAELACVHSGILGYEELMPYPNTAASVEHDQMTQQVAWSYDAQLWLRKHLNDIHAHYNPSDTYSSFHLFRDKKQKPHQFSSIEAVETTRREQFSYNKFINNTIWPSLAWNFDDPSPDLAQDILSARTRAKFYGARVITYRPFVQQILEYSWGLQNAAGGENPPVANVDLKSSLPGVTALEIVDPSKTLDCPQNAPIEDKIIAAYGEAHWGYFHRGLAALIHSTTAFHGMDSSRLIVTNVFGTVHAQWGNVLVLLGVYNDAKLKHILLKLISEEELKSLVLKTASFLKDVAHPTSGLQTDIRILKAAALKANILTREECTPGSSYDEMPPVAISFGSNHDTDMS